MIDFLLSCTPKSFVQLFFILFISLILNVLLLLHQAHVLHLQFLELIKDKGKSFLGDCACQEMSLKGFSLAQTNQVSLLEMVNSHTLFTI